MGGWHKVGSDDAFPIRQALPVGLGFGTGFAGLGFYRKFCVVDSIHLYELHPFLWLQRGRHGWMTLDLFVSQLKGSHIMI